MKMIDDKYDIVRELKSGVFIVLATYEGHQNWLYRVIRNVAGYWEEAHCEDSKEVGVMPTEGWGWEDSGTREDDALYDAALVVWRKKHPNSNEMRLLEWLMSEDWVVCDSKTHLALEPDKIQRSFGVRFPDTSVSDSGDLSIENVPFGPVSGLAPDANSGSISFSDSENSKVTAVNADDLVVEKRDGSLEIMSPMHGEMIIENKWFDSTPDSGDMKGLILAVEEKRDKWQAEADFVKEHHGRQSKKARLGQASKYYCVIKGFDEALVAIRAFAVKTGG